MIQMNSRVYRLEGPLKLRVSRPVQTEEARFEFAADLMKRLSEKPKVMEKSQAEKPHMGQPKALDKPNMGQPNMGQPKGKL
jgi:hypothetical protein